MNRAIDRHLPIWRRAFDLGWPITVEHALNTMMRTVDIIVTGLFSPAAVAAIGLADLYGNVPLRIGQGLGTGALAIGSQDTGRGVFDTRNEALTQAMVIGILCGLPFLALGVLFSQALIEVLGAESEVVRLGGLYLALILAIAPMRIIGRVGAKALQGAGDTRTPMIVNGTSNVLNIVLTVTLGIGLLGAPRLGILGVGIATAVSRVLEGVLMTAAIFSARTPLSFAWPREVVITRQIVRVSVPRFLEGMSTTVVSFPFNALVLLFGTEAYAAYSIARRIYQQLGAPLYRALGNITTIIVGQELGRGDNGEAKEAAKSILLLAVLLLGGFGLFLFVGAEWVISLITQDRTTIDFAIVFVRVLAVSLFFYGIFYTLAGVLNGAGDTRTPFYARLGGEVLGMLGVSYLLGVVLGYGLNGVYIGIASTYLFEVVVVGLGFTSGGWQTLAASIIAERAEAEQRRSGED